MDNPLEESTHSKARELARQITVAHDLDPEIQEELYGHIEDKLLAYKNGDEPLTEEDAYLLVREHFGDANVLTEMFAEVHQGAVTLSLGRRVAAACIITLTVTWLCKLLALPLQGLALRLVDDGSSLFGGGDLLAFFLYHATAPLLVLGVAGTFYYGHKGLAAGKRPWFYRWSMWDFLRVGTLLLVALAITPSLEVAPFHTLAPALAQFAPSDIDAFFGRWVLHGALVIAWLWWCGADRSRPQSVYLCMPGWVALQMVLSLIPIQLLLGTGNNMHDGTLLEGAFASTPVLGEQYVWFLYGDSFLRAVADLPGLLLHNSLCALFSLVLYFLATGQFRSPDSPDREFTDTDIGLRLMSGCLLPPAMAWLLLEQRGWTPEVLWAIAFIATLTSMYLRIQWVDVPRAIASRHLHRLRALRYGSNILLLSAFLVPSYLRHPDRYAGNPADAVYLPLFFGAMAWMVGAAWVNWRKRERSADPHHSIVRR